MKLELFEGKTKEEALEKGLIELHVQENEVVYKSEEIKGGLFKSGGFKVSILPLSEVSEFIKTELTYILNKMDIDVSFETKVRHNKVQVKMYSDRNSILIGKNGKTLDALNIIIKQSIYNKTGLYPYFSLDVENYKEKQEEHIERLAKKIAKEVVSTKVDASLESMNSYERRIVHNCLTNFKGVITTSEGEEPNRYVVIKYQKTENEE